METQTRSFVDRGALPLSCLPPWSLATVSSPLLTISLASIRPVLLCVVQTVAGTLHRVMAQLPEDHAPFTRLLAEGAVGCWEAGHGCVVMGGAAQVTDEPKPCVAHVDGVVAPPSSCSIPVTHPLHPAGLVPHGLPWPPPQQQHYQQHYQQQQRIQQLRHQRRQRLRHQQRRQRLRHQRRQRQRQQQRRQRPQWQQHRRHNCQRQQRRQQQRPQ